MGLTGKLLLAAKKAASRTPKEGDEVGLEGRTLRYTAAGWRRVDPKDPRKTHNLTPAEKTFIGRFTR